MAESSLAAAYKDLTGDVGHFLGYGRGADNGDTAWTTPQQRNIDRCVKGGLRNFYFSGIEWSFLKPVAALTLAAESQTVELPDDYGGSEGRITVSTSSADSWQPLDFGPIGAVYQKHALYPSTTGWPECCCEEPIKGTGPTQGQRFRLRVWPIADQAYTLKFQYYVLPDYLSGAFPYVYGGAMHAETVLESCLAVAEKILDDQATVHAAEFQMRLAVSKDLDARQKPQHLGYNGDRSDMRGSRREWRDWPTVTFNGVEYD